MRAVGPNFKRDRLAMLVALVTVACLCVTFVFAKGRHFLMPGPLASAHGSIESCNSCHTNSGSGKLSWVHGLVSGDRMADSKACLTCHKMPDTAFNAHSASTEMLQQSTDRLMKTAAKMSVPQAARVQNAAFPASDVVARGLFCSTCHQEHQGAEFKLNKISNEQCRSCHVVKFDSFDGKHPNFDNYPFERRSRIIYDHAGHFGKHYPEVAKKDPAKRIPDTCASCHTSAGDKRVMAVAPFEKTCSGCHLGQITGKERATGPKGIAFLTVPGLDLPTLKDKNAAIGEWPDASDAVLTPFMKVMISRTERGQGLIKTVGRLNLQDLSQANDAQIKAVTDLAWEIKGLFHALIKGKASDVLGDLNLGGGAKLSTGLVADLTASIPRDVLISAQQQWLPNLAAEMASPRVTNDQKQSGAGPANTDAKDASPQAKPPAADERQAATARAEDGAREKGEATIVKPDGTKKTRSTGTLPPPMRAGVGDDEKGSANAGADDGAAEHDGADGRQRLPSGTPRSIRNKSEPKEKNEKSEPAKAKTDDGGEPAKAAQPDAATDKADTAKAPAADTKEPPPADASSPASSSGQSDDLLFPTEAELREMKTLTGKSSSPSEAGGKSNAATASKPDDAAPAASGSSAIAKTPAGASAGSAATAASPQSKAVPVISIGSDVDPESWAEYGGWYQQDYAIFYRPTGHKDKFIYSWLFLTGPQAPKDDKSPAAAVFEYLTGKEAQGSCAKCHSVDDIQSKGRLVNFTPASVANKQGRFTKFVHEPHFGVMENRGCLTCHNLEKDRPYLKGYEQGNPHNQVSNFGEVKKDLCKSCHSSNMARQDCLLCHNYHVDGVATPIMSTKLPIQ